jgi:hypothetical protein
MTHIKHAIIHAKQYYGEPNTILMTAYCGYNEFCGACTFPKLLLHNVFPLIPLENIKPNYKSYLV